MNEFLFGLALNAAVFLPAGAFFFWRYRVAIGLPARLREFQYRLFALRDRAINLVVDGVMKEDDPRWKSLYEHLNASARPISVKHMKHGLSFVLAMLRNAEPPGNEELRQFESLPKPVKELYADWVKTILGICFEGSPTLRLIVRLAIRYKFVKKWLQERRTLESDRYRGFKHAEHRMCMAA